MKNSIESEIEELLVGLPGVVIGSGSIVFPLEIFPNVFHCSPRSGSPVEDDPKTNVSLHM
jgi:hypothetical protein